MNPTTDLLPSRTVTVILQGESISISYPKTGEYIDIENEKNRLAANRFNGYYRFDDSGLYARMLLEAVAFFSIMLPEDVRSRLNVKSFLELDMMLTNELVIQYNSIVSPWMKEWHQVLTKHLS